MTILYGLGLVLFTVRVNEMIGLSCFLKFYY